MLSVIGTVNSGYKIFGVVMFDDFKGCAVGHQEMSDESVSYVAWNFNLYNDDLSFYWGHYCSTMNAVMESFMEKIEAR